MASTTFVDGNILTAAQMNTLGDTVDGYATTATAAGTTTLTVASKYQQFFTGSTTQTVTMPVASTLVVGWKIRVRNNSTGIVTVNSSGANAIYAIPAGGDTIFTCILASGTSAASWDYLDCTVTGSPAAGTTSTGATGAGYMGIPQNAATTGSYGVVAADAGTHIHSTATRTVTLPANGTIALPIGYTITFTAATGATVTIAITTDTMYLAGPGTTGSRTLAPFGMATAIKIGATSWMISGNGLT